MNQKCNDKSVANIINDGLCSTHNHKFICTDCGISVERLVLSVNEFCASLSIGRSKFYDEVHKGRIKILKAGRRTLVPIGQREAFLQRLAEESGK